MSKKFLSGINVTGTATLNTVADAGSNTDKFLVLDSSNNVSYRTAAELYADLGIGSTAAAYTSTLKHEVKASQTISKGQAVYVSSADGTNMIVSKASNVSEQFSSKTMGLLETSLVANGKGNVITEGLLSGLNTNGANAGDPVWLGVDGALIFGLANKPYAPAHLVFIGIVTRANANNGEIFVKVQNGFEMKELHNYAEGSVQNNEVIVYESATSLYKPKSIPTILGYTPVPDSRTITINGTSYDLSANRSWTITTDASARSILRYVATASQTTFTISGGYTPGLTDVYRNGVKLDNSTDFTATNGTTIVLTNGASVNDVIEVYRYQTAFLANNALRTVTEFIATAGQTTFSVTYNSGLVDVFYNGSKLVSSEFTAGNGTTIVLNFPCNLNDSVAVHAYSYTVGAFTGQAQLNGTGFVKASGTTITYDNSTYLTSINSSQVTTALGYTPYNATNPSGYITSSSLSAYLPLTGGTLTGALSGTSATFSSSFNLGSIANSGDLSLLNIKQASTGYNNGIYLERGGERNGYFMYIGGAVDSLTFRRNYFGTQSDVMSLTREGNIIINGTTAQNTATDRGNLTINGTTSVLNLSTNNTNSGYIYHGGTDMLLVNAKNGNMLFYANDTERMRISSNTRNAELDLRGNTISSFTGYGGTVGAGSSWSMTINQVLYEFETSYMVDVIGFYAPGGVNIQAWATGIIHFMSDGSTNGSHYANITSNGFSISVSSTNAGVYTVTFTNTSGSSMSNNNARILKINRMN